MEKKIFAQDLNKALEQPLAMLSEEDLTILIQELIKRLVVEFKKNDRSGIYAKTQTEMAYNSNKIEGSTLTPDQTASLFSTGTLRSDGDIVYRAKDIEEMTGHFSMFNRMLESWDQPLSEKLIKEYHFCLKAGVFEDRANGYPVGEYKNRVNYVSNIQVANPAEVAYYMSELIRRYEKIEKVTVTDLAKFHADFEKIHPFQDGNGRTGRMILFKECLRKGIIPILIRDTAKEQYYYSLNKAQKENDFGPLIRYFHKEQEFYYEIVKTFLWKYKQTESVEFEESSRENCKNGFLSLGDE